MPEMSYPGRDALRIMAAQVDAEPERSGRAYIARSLLAALDAHGHDLEALARRLDVHDQQIADPQQAHDDGYDRGHADGYEAHRLDYEAGI